jgi:hypothetical protein
MGFRFSFRGIDSSENCTLAESDRCKVLINLGFRLHRTNDALHQRAGRISLSAGETSRDILLG